MKKILSLIIICLFSQMTLAQNTLENSAVVYQDTTRGFAFEVNYWFNLHHFLWMESFMALKMDSTIIDQKLSENAQHSLDKALDYYKENLADLDLRTDDYMSEFKNWITNEGREMTSIPTKFKNHVEVLKSVSEVYKKFFWPAHKQACEEVLKNNIGLVRRTEAKFAEGITKLTRQFWQFERVKVDITYFGKATTWNPKDRPYTSIFPTHVVMNVQGLTDVEGNWLELLYHEAAHHLILGSSYFVAGTIKDVSEVLSVEPPRQLWHAYLFYLTGELTKQILNQEGIPYAQTYMKRENVFSRYYEAIDKHLKLYMSREITLEDATRKIIADLK